MSNRLTALSGRIARLGIQQQRLSELTGLDKSTLSRAINGHTRPLEDTVDKIEQAVIAEEQRVREHLAGLAAPQNGAAA